MEKSEVIQKIICTFLWSENIRFYIFTSENIKYTIYINNISLYFTTLYIIKDKMARPVGNNVASTFFKALVVMDVTLSMTSQISQDDFENKIAEANAKYFKVI